jgi:hypothetical protein
MREYADTTTGEMVHIVPVRPEKASKQRYAHPGGYCVMGLVNIKKLYTLRLPADAYRLAFVIAERVAPVTGMCHCTNQEYADLLGVRLQRVSDLVRILREHRLIYRVGPRTVLANPSWCFRGTPQQQYAAIEEWSRLHPMKIVRREPEQMSA